MQHSSDFSFIDEGAVYLDAACQSLRPLSVQAALQEYYQYYNSCGERVKHEWGARVDREVEATRKKILRFLKLSPKQYEVSFTLNTTYGINLVLSQLRPERFAAVITSDIEHNSVFLPTMAFAKRGALPRIVVRREKDGAFPVDIDYSNALVVVNAVSNIDGRELRNIAQVIKTVHRAGGVVIVDAAQTMAHSRHLLMKTDADAICFSAHKMYSASLGGMIVKKSLLKQLETSFIGGGMVTDVQEDSYVLDSNEPHTQLEVGLQAYGEIIALGAAIDWLEQSYARGDSERLSVRARRLYEFLLEHPKVTLLNTTSSTTLAFYHESLDAHLLARVLSDEKIMTRSGYFCCHYYLKHQEGYPPLVRMSLGLHTTDQDIDTVISVLEKVLV